MNEKEQQNRKLILTIMGVSILVVATIGATIAYFSATSSANPQNITTGELKVAAESKISNNSNIKPATWDDTNMENNNSNTDIARIELTVDTTGTTIKTGKYDILLTTTGIKLNAETEELKGGKLSDVKWALYKLDSEGAVAKADGKIGEGNFSKSGQDEGTGEISGDVNDLIINNSKEDGNNSIAITPDSADDNPKAKDYYCLYIWIENTMDTAPGDGTGKQDRLQNLDITATLTVDAKQ